MIVLGAALLQST